MNGPPYDVISGENAGAVVCRNSQGLEAHGTVLQMQRHRVTFEVYTPFVLLQFSEVLNDFKISVNGQSVYFGRAVVRNLINTATVTICEANLDDCWTHVDVALLKDMENRLAMGFEQFLGQWQKLYKIRQEYKAIIGELQTFLTDLRLWLERLELGIRSSPAVDRLELEREIAHRLRGRVSSALSQLFEQFEAISNTIEDDLQPAHRAFGQRQLHPHLLCAPFIYRTYAKPLGYAGDYEMMNMIMRNGYEGGSLYAKLINAYLLDQQGPEAVRNRVGLLQTKIVEETGRISRLGKTANIFCVACGPAWEVVNFVREHPLADQARFELLDFNEETLQYADNKLQDVKRAHLRKTEFKLTKNSVHNLLRTGGKPVAASAKFDLVYCSGLYDYLNSRVCKALNNYLYDLLLPGGLLVIGNFGPHTPVKHFIEHFLEWFLIYRDDRQLMSLAPDSAPADNCTVKAEPTGCNIFLEVRKPV